jgi:CheY-like chemotaxis protein
VSDSIKTVLIIEDDENDVFFLERALELTGLQLSVHIVTDGEQALQYLDGKAGFSDRAAHPLPSVIFLDLKLPYITGFEVLKFIRSKPTLAKMPVIILTSSSEDRDRLRASELGATAYLVKPAKPETLGLALNSINGWSSTAKC